MFKMTTKNETNWLKEAINNTPHGEVEAKINQFLNESGKSRPTFDRYRRTGEVPSLLEEKLLKQIFNA